MFLYDLFTTISFPGFGQFVLGLSLDFHIIITYILFYYYRQYLNLLVSKMELVALVFNGGYCHSLPSLSRNVVVRLSHPHRGDS